MREGSPDLIWERTPDHCGCKGRTLSRQRHEIATITIVGSGPLRLPNEIRPRRLARRITSCLPTDPGTTARRGRRSSGRRAPPTAW